MPPLRSLASLAVAVALAACGGDADAGDPAAPPREIEAADLAGLVLRADEAPEGTDYLAESSGMLMLKDLWNPACCPGQIAAFEEAGFSTGYRSFFQQPGHSGDPIDARPGVEVASSTAVLFTNATGASRALRDWYAYYEAPVFELVGKEGLGEEAIAVMGSPDAPAEIVFLYLWRIDKLVLSLRVSAGRGSVSLEQVRTWVDRMDARAS